MRRANSSVVEPSTRSHGRGCPPSVTGTEKSHCAGRVPTNGAGGADGISSNVHVRLRCRPFTSGPVTRHSPMDPEPAVNLTSQASVASAIVT